MLKVGGKFLLKLNICGRPIDHKYRKGKLQINLKIELKITWNIIKGSKGNQCHRDFIFPAPLFDVGTVACLWLTRLHLGRYGRSGGSLFECIWFNFPCTGMKWRESMCNHDYGKGFSLPYLKTWTKSLKYMKIMGGNPQCKMKVKEVWSAMLYVQWPWYFCRNVWVRAYTLGPKIWWTMPEEDETRGDSGGSV